VAALGLPGGWCGGWPLLPSSWPKADTQAAVVKAAQTPCLTCAASLALALRCCLSRCGGLARGHRETKQS